MDTKNAEVTPLASRYPSPYTPKHLRFLNQEKREFYEVLKKRVAEEFAEQGIKPTGNWVLYTKTVIILAAYLLLCALIYSDAFGPWGVIGLYALLGIVMDFVGFNIAHDCLHYSYFSSPKWSRRLGYIFDLDGESSYIWQISHNIHHHVYTNIPGHDNDIDKASVFRFNPSDPLLPHHRYQHLYAPFVYLVSTLNWTFFSDYLWIFREIKKGAVKGIDIFMFFLMKGLNLFFFLFLPMAILSVPWWVPVLGIIVMHAAAGLFSALVFQMGHVVEGPIFVEPDEKGNMPYEWSIHEMLTTSNFATDNWFVTQWTGGLNFQLEHHLFPHISHVHYPLVAKILKKTAKEFLIPYNEIPTFSDAIRSHFRLLKWLGRAQYTAILRKRRNETPDG